ncbi:MAG: hypothetical protein K2K36_03785 [Muribaculaceae bacterium]|nr:hypothetical protein [Muribaculaceae bacterium]
MRNFITSAAPLRLRRAPGGLNAGMPAAEAAGCDLRLRALPVTPASVLNCFCRFFHFWKSAKIISPREIGQINLSGDHFLGVAEMRLPVLDLALGGASELAGKTLQSHLFFLSARNDAACVPAPHP